MATYEQLSGHGAPSNKTVGKVGQMYVDLDTGKEYVCAQIFTVTGYKIKKELYSWVDRELDPDEYATDEEVAIAMATLKEEIKEEISGGSVIEGGIPIYAEFVD